MAVLMTAVYDFFGNVIGSKPLEATATLQSTNEAGEAVAVGTANFETHDLTTTDEIELTSTDTTITDVGKGVILGHPVHLEVKKVGADVSVSQNWDGGEW